MSPTAEERETTIQYDDAGDMATVYTCHKALAERVLRLKSRGAVLLNEYRNSGKVVAWQFRVPKAWIRIRPVRLVSEANRQAARERAIAGGFTRKTRPVIGRSEQGGPIPEVSE